MRNKKTVFVAMSGGVDSSVAAALLKKQSYEVVGVFMKNWSQKIEGVNYCSTEEDFRDMRSVCQHLDIPYYVFNFEEEYKKQVLDYFFKEYRAGRTPNPDVMCNKEIKFGLFLDCAMKFGADFIATGHHIRKSKTIRPRLLKGRDRIKDQTYFVYNLNQEQLNKCLFPIGEYTKPQIRALAKRMKLPTADKKDSQGICFIGPVDVKKFLKTVISQKKGRIVNTEGETLGTHEGAWFYTIGQRRIDGLSGQKAPLYVVNTDIKKNLVIVGTDEETYSRGVVLEGMHWVDPKYKMPKKLTAKPRYGPDVYPGRLEKNTSGPDLRFGEPPGSEKGLKARRGRLWSFVFDKPQRALTPGQSLVIYDREICLGGGVIESVLRRSAG